MSRTETLFIALFHRSDLWRMWLPGRRWSRGFTMAISRTWTSPSTCGGGAREGARRAPAGLPVPSSARAWELQLAKTARCLPGGTRFGGILTDPSFSCVIKCGQVSVKKTQCLYAGISIPSLNSKLVLLKIMAFLWNTGSPVLGLASRLGS